MPMKHVVLKYGKNGELRKLESGRKGPLGLKKKRLWQAEGLTRDLGKGRGGSGHDRIGLETLTPKQ